MIDKIGHYSITNPASVYDEEALTALELAGRTAGKVNECVEQFNKLETETTTHLKQQDESIPDEVERAIQKHIDEGAFDKAISDYAGGLEERLDNIIQGDGDVNPELMDARLTAYGNTYPTTGEAIRAQTVELQSGVNKPNLINLNTLSAGYLGSETGEVALSHQTGSFQKWEYTSDFIPVVKDNNDGKNYVFSIRHNKPVDGWMCICVYDSNKKFINRDRVYTYSASEYTKKFRFFEDNVAFVRISYRSYMVCDVKFEFSNIQTQLKGVEEKANLLESYPLQFDGYIVSNGSIYPQTPENYFEGVPQLLEKYTRHIPVKEGETYILYHIADAYGWGAVGIYGEDGTALQRLTFEGKKPTFTIPSGAVSMIICARTYYLKGLALFKQSSPMTAQQRAFENYLNIETLQNTETVLTESHVKAINHRGYNSEAPENTLSAFKLSAEKGFKYVECDVRFTSDGVPVLLHDETVDRTSNGTGYISVMKFNDVRALDFGNGEKIPTFEEFLALCKSYGLHAYVEMKNVSETQIKKLVLMVRMYGMREYVTFISFNHLELIILKKYDATARLGYLANSLSMTEINRALEMKTRFNEVFINLAVGFVTNSGVKLCAENGIPLEVWTVNNEINIYNINPYVTGITSDRLHAGQVLRERNIICSMTNTVDINLLPNGDTGCGCDENCDCHKDDNSGGSEDDGSEGDSGGSEDDGSNSEGGDNVDEPSYETGILESSDERLYEIITVNNGEICGASNINSYLSEMNTVNGEIVNNVSLVIDGDTVDSCIIMAGNDLITGVSPNGFQNNPYITSMIIANVDEVKEFAFKNCVNLISVALRSPVPCVIGARIFDGCSSLKYISIQMSYEVFQEKPKEDIAYNWLAGTRDDLLIIFESGEVFTKTELGY